LRRPRSRRRFSDPSYVHAYRTWQEATESLLRVRAGSRRNDSWMNADHYNPDPRAQPGLQVIAIVEAAKGVLAILAASGLELLGPASLRSWVEALIVRFQLDPHHGAMAWLGSTINPDSVHIAAAVAIVYGVMRVTESWGLWRAKAWASWLGCIGAALYLPFDVYALAGHPGWLSVAVVGINLLVVWVLARDLLVRRRERA
jgi:uncharacterized membrane protein (DUF2068 family)